MRVSLSHLFRETGTTVSTFEWSENVTGSTQAGLPGHSQNERQGNCFLSYLFRESGTIVLMFKRSENVIRISGPLYSGARCFLIGGLKKNIVHEVCAKFVEVHPNVFKPHPFCANFAVKWIPFFTEFHSKAK